MLFGCAWVSTGDQDSDHQIEALLRTGAARDVGRQLQRREGVASRARRAVADAVQGRHVRVTPLDRLSRSVLHLVILGADHEEQLRRLERRTGRKTG